jgi:hypothetical protein
MSTTPAIVSWPLFHCLPGNQCFVDAIAGKNFIPSLFTLELNITLKLISALLE